MNRPIPALLALVSLVSALSLTEPVKVIPRVDYDLGVVFLERWRGDYYLGIEKVLKLDEYLKYQMQASVQSGWKREATIARKQKEFSLDASGLIPDIELPKLPVFGEGSKIDISGQDRITLGGRQTVVEGVATPGGSRLLPELKMEQQLAVRLNGSIGERTKVSIDHDSQRQQGNNKIKLTYTGTEDDLVQSVELGDTRLVIPGTAYTGDLPAHKGLFGVSARGKLGGVDLYGIASREESQSQSQSFTGKRRTSVDTIYGRDYVARRFYHIDVPGNLLGLRVYVDDNTPSNNQSAIKAIATVFPDRPDSVPARWNWDRDGGDFDLKSVGADYVLLPNNILEFSQSLNPQDVVGLVVFTDRDTLGGQMHNDSLVLKLLKPERTDSLSLAWDYEMKNVYALPQREIQLSGFRLYRDEPTGSLDAEYENAGPNSGRMFSQVLGLDQNGDGRLEYPEFDSKTGLIRFPTAKPFASDGLSVRDSVIYRKQPLESDEGRKYYMVAEYSSATESYYLGQVDIEENSERVRVDGMLWTRGTDYDINYSSGILTFRRTLPADASISVTFEYRPWFSLSQRTLVGTRGEWSFAQNGKLGSSVFYRTEGLSDDKPALGSEPSRRVIAEADASYSASSNEVSAVIDRLPVLRAQSPSTFTASVEGAVSLPDPNTRGLAYLDDFEGTTITRDVSNNSILWSYASVPVGKDTSEFCREPLFWWTPTKSSELIRKDSVFGPNLGDEGSETQDFLRVVMKPDPGRPESWAGLMMCPSQMGMNLKDIKNLEMVVKSRRGRGRIHVTVGMSIDEDAPRRTKSGRIAGYNGRMDTEDRNGNGVLDEGLEDTGLDAVFGSDTSWKAGAEDDGNDDYDLQRNQMGTENNNRLDAEDLDHSGFSRYNHYFECNVPIGDRRYSSNLYGDWKLYRVTLEDTTAFRSVGSPKWEDIRLVRLWFDGFDEIDTIDFYSIQFVGSRWRNPRVVRSDESGPGSDTGTARIPQRRRTPADTSERVWVAQISRKTDTSYVPPFELKKDIYGRVEQEASLLFGYRSLAQGSQAVTEKVSANKDDFREYRELRMYVHEDGNGLPLLVRFGADSVNYYEYRARAEEGRLVPGRDGKWYEFVIDLDSFPVLKYRRDSLRQRGESLPAGRYRLSGTPSLADVRYQALGIVQTRAGSASGGIWFDDIRLAGPRRDPGYGFQARATAGLSDLVSAGLSMTYSDPNFRRFSEAPGVKTGGFGTGINADLRANLDRFLPAGWGLSVPLSYAISRQRDVGKYSSVWPDLRLDRDKGTAEATQAGSEDIALTNVRKQSSRSKLLNYTLEAMSFSWRRRQAQRQSLLSRDSSWSRMMALSYGISPDLDIELWEGKDLSLFPQSIKFGVTDGQDVSVRATRQTVNDSFLIGRRRGHGLNSDFSASYSPFDNLDLEYGIESDRDLLVANPDSLWRLAIGIEASRGENFNASYSMEIGDFLTPSVEFDGNYSDERSKLDSSRYADYRNMENSGNIGLNLGVELPELFRWVKGSGRGPLSTVRNGVGKLAEVLDPIEFEYSFDRSSDMVKVTDRAPWHYRLGFTNGFDYDSTNPPSSVNRESDNSLRLSSGAKFKEFRAGVSYDWSLNREERLVGNTSFPTADVSIRWPDLDLSLGGVHRLFPKLSSDSKLSGSYRRRYTLSGQPMADSLAMYGRTESWANELSPLASWTTTWKQKVSTTLSLNYTSSAAMNYLSESGRNRSQTNSDSRSGDFSMSYSFAAPQGIKLPGLNKLRFSSDLRLTWSMRYSYDRQFSIQWVDDRKGDPIERQRDRSYSTRVAGSYSFSRSIEAGSNLGYTYTKGITGTGTRATDLDIWVLFRF